MRKAIGSAGLAAVISMGLLAAFPVMAWAAPVLPEGISAGSQSLAGMTAEEAKAAVEQYVDGLAGQKVILSVDGQDVETTARELGFHWSNTQAVDEAAGPYAGGSLIKQYMVQKDLAAAPVDLELDTAVDSEKVKAFVDTQCQAVTAQPQDASITRENGQFVITDSVAGKVVTGLRRLMRMARSLTALAEACARFPPHCIMHHWKRNWRLSRDRTTP